MVAFKFYPEFMDYFMEGKSSVMDASTFNEGSLRARNKQFCS
jgi:hypothetical protein